MPADSSKRHDLRTEARSHLGRAHAHGPTAATRSGELRRSPPSNPTGRSGLHRGPNDPSSDVPGWDLATLAAPAAHGAPTRSQLLPERDLAPRRTVSDVALDRGRAMRREGSGGIDIFIPTGAESLSNAVHNGTAPCNCGSPSACGPTVSRTTPTPARGAAQTSGAPAWIRAARSSRGPRRCAEGRSTRHRGGSAARVHRATSPSGADRTRSREGRARPARPLPPVEVDAARTVDGGDKIAT